MGTPLPKGQENWLPEVVIFTMPVLKDFVGNLTACNAYSTALSRSFVPL
jgi:hypothetical protein